MVVSNSGRLQNFRRVDRYAANRSDYLNKKKYLPSQLSKSILSYTTTFSFNGNHEANHVTLRDHVLVPVKQ